MYLHYFSITASTTLGNSANFDDKKKSSLKEPLMDSTGPSRQLSSQEIKADTIAEAQALNKADAFQSAFHLSPAPVSI